MKTEKDRVKLDVTNPVIKSIMNRGLVANPNYNPKTKKGRQEPKYVKDPNIYDYTKDAASAYVDNINKIGFTPTDLGLTDEDYEEYQKYGVAPSPFKTQEEIDKKRGENQSAFEQAGRFIGQLVVNEVALGTALGLSNLVDATINGVRHGIAKMNGEEYTHDYTNALSKELEDVQNNIRKELAIYRENPNEAWAFDSGWLFDNLVSIGSTASMLIPTMMVTKGISLLGKGVRAVSKGGRMAKTLDMVSADNIASKLSTRFNNKFKDAGALSDRLRMGREITQNAFMSRTMEGYLEARSVYNDVHTTALYRLKQMKPEEKEEFFKNNENLRGKSDEEIADYISGNSADETFVNDYAMLLMDIVQFKALGELYKGGRKMSNATLALNKKKAKDRLLGIVNDNPKFKDSDFMFKLKYQLTHPMEGLFAVQWSEGFEEGYQGVQVEKGKEVAEKIFDPTYTEKELTDYLTDPHIYEQAFWGVVGAVGFGLGAKGIKKAYNLADKSLEKYFYDEKEIFHRRLAEIKQRQSNIDNWSTKSQEFIKAAGLINEGKNIFAEPITDEEGNVTYQDIEGASQEEIKNTKELMLDNLFNQYVSEMAMDAIDRGNYNILDAFLSDREVNSFIRSNSNITATDEQFEQRLRNKMQEVSDLYTKTVVNIRNSINVKNPYIPQKMARTIVRTKLNIKDLNAKIDETSAKINELSDVDYNDFETKQISEYVDSKLQELNALERKYERMFAENKLSVQAYNEYLDTINRKRLSVMQFANESVVALSQMEEFSKLFLALHLNESSKLDNAKVQAVINEFNKFKSQLQPTSQVKPTKEVQRLLAKRAGYRFSVIDATNQLPKTQEEYQKEYDAQAMLIDKIVHERYDKAVDNVNEWIEKQDDLNKAKFDLLNDNVEELKDDLDILKIGHESTKVFWFHLNNALNVEQQRRTQNEQARRTVVVDNEVNEEASSEELAPEEAPEGTNEEDSSTGEGQSPVTTGPAEGERPGEPERQRPPSEPDNTAPIIEDEGRRNYETEEISEADKKVLDALMEEASKDEVSENIRRADAVARKILNGKVDTIKRLTVNDKESREYIELTAEIAEAISIETGLNAGQSLKLAERGMKIWFNMAGKRKGIANFVELANSLAFYTRYSSTGLLEDITTKEEKLQLVKDVLASYIKERNIKHTANNKTINLYDVYNSVVENTDIDIDTAINFFINLQTIIKNNRSALGYRFENIKIFNKLLESPQHIIATLDYIRNKQTFTNKYEHLNLANNEFARELARTIDQNTMLEIDYTPVNRDGSPRRSISFKHNGVEVAYLATVTKSDDNNSYTLNSDGFGKNGNGSFILTVTANPNGTFSTGEFDRFIRELILDEDPSKLTFIKQMLNGTLPRTAENETRFVNDAAIKYLEQLGIIKYKTPLSNTTKTDAILRSLQNIIYYKGTAKDAVDRYTSWEEYKAKLYKNYEFTHRLMTTPNATVRMQNLWDGGVLYGDTNYDVNTRKFSAERDSQGKIKNPIVGVVSSTQIIAEGYSESFPNPALFEPGTMGIMVRNAVTGPAIALITDTNTVSSNAKIAKMVKDELNSLFTKYQTRDDYTIEMLIDDLKALMRGPNSKSYGLFQGLSVIHNANNELMSIGLKTRTDTKYFIKVAKYKKNTKELNKTIYFYPEGDNSKRVTITPNNVNTLTDFIVNNLKFDTTFFTLKNINSKNVANTKYMYIDNNGKFVINIGNKELKYDSFTDFVLTENAFKTNQEISNGSYFFDYAKGAIFVDTEVTVHTPSPVKESKSLQELSSTPKSTPIPIQDVLDYANTDEATNAFITGANEFSLNLLPTEVYFDKGMRQKDDAKHTKGKIYIGDNFLRNANNSTYLYSKLIHENIHKHFAELDDVDKVRILSELSDTYEAFIRALEKDVNDTSSPRHEQAVQIQEWINNNKFNPNDYGSTLPYKAKQAYYKNGIPNTDTFFEEWLTESLTQPAIMQYLNSVYYGEVNVDTNKAETIFQKIIKVLLRLFGKDYKDINRNTILAKQFEILGNKATNETTTTTEEKVAEPTTTPVEEKTEEPVAEKTEEPVAEPNDTKNGTDIINLDEITDDKIPDEIRDNFNFDDLQQTEEDFDLTDDEIDDLSVTGIIDNTEYKIESFTNDSSLNPAGLSILNKMNDYLEKFSESDKAIVQKAIEENTLSYICY